MLDGMIKYNSDVSVERLKDILVIFENYKTDVIDYTKTFAPVA